MKKKILSLALVVAMIAIIAAGSLAYFTDKDSETNVFTVGNVDIEIRESTLHRTMDEATDEQILEDSEFYQTYLAAAGKDIVPGQWVYKAPYIENVGSNAAYVRVNMTLPVALDNLMEIMEYTTAQEEGAISKVSSKVDGDMITYTWTFLKPIAPGALSYYAPFWQFRLAPGVTNEQVAAFDGDVVNEIVVTADAIQAVGFDSAAEAFAAFDAE